MNVALLENCKTLFDLSGWGFKITDTSDNTEFLYDDGGLTRKGEAIASLKTAVPAYDLGYLLRKLQHLGVSVRANGFGTWEAETDSADLGPDPSDQYEATMNTPEDALALLCIYLFKNGTLTRDSIREGQA